MSERAKRQRGPACPGTGGSSFKGLPGGRFVCLVCGQEVAIDPGPRVAKHAASPALEAWRAASRAWEPARDG